MAFDLRLLGAFGRGLATGDSVTDQLANGLNAIGDARVAQGQRNKTLEFLQAQSPEIADAIGKGLLTPADGVKLHFAQVAETRKAQDPANRYKAVGGSLYDVQSGDWISPPAGSPGTEEWGLSPVWGKDASGKTVLGQVSKTGKFKPLDTGDFTPTPGISNIDAGTSVVSRNSRTGEIVAQTPKDVAGEAAARAGGTATGEAAAALPSARSLANTVSQQINDLKNDPYLPSMVGPGQSKLPNITADAARVQSKMDQVQGGAFLQGRQLLKGGGAITDFESQKAEAAFARLNVAQRVEDYKAALDDFNAAVQEGVRKLEAQARGGTPAGGQADPLGIR